ncbi:hypothetical protein AVEN_210971-1 [Araneus ventricosus]|uniref:Uncharacterized protein n=1 Tax=Araneus ventricosus TaxID=182803 RepID=A0A4Y2RX94_ARAVE|nr:hypothetical protein AVEN_210971-1 [Araneus ventricosus]
MYRSFQNETNPLPKLWIRINDSESESVIPNQSESNSDSRIRFRGITMNPIIANSSRIRFGGFITNPIPRIHHESDSEDPFLLVGIGSGRSF